jgi:hypothetical protein
MSYPLKTAQTGIIREIGDYRLVQLGDVGAAFFTDLTTDGLE